VLGLDGRIDGGGQFVLDGREVDGAAEALHQAQLDDVPLTGIEPVDRVPDELAQFGPFDGAGDVRRFGPAGVAARGGGAGVAARGPAWASPSFAYRL
jgi:hypothetical protein